jgi:dipeptidase D
MRNYWLISFVFSVIVQLSHAESLSEDAIATALYAEKYQTAQIELLRQLVAFKTVADPQLPLVENPEFIGFKKTVFDTAKSFGLQAFDYGAMVVVTLGDQDRRIGIVTHGDVQPADASKWKQSPFLLDSKSQPGKLIARGTEDDKGPIATALYAMKAIREQNIPLQRRIELMIYLAEESDWQPLIDYIANNTVPDLNVTIDASYPVVTAEKGFSTITVTVPATSDDSNSNYNTGSSPRLLSFTGGAFTSQIPENGYATITHADENLLARLKTKAASQSNMTYDFKLDGNQLGIIATGKSAHSSTPKSGVNGIAHLADLLASESWPTTSASLSVAYVAELAGTGYYGEKFGDLAYQHDFMGQMTLAPTLIREDDKGTNITINIRRPAGKTAEQCIADAEQALRQWQARHQIDLENIQLNFGEPLLVEGAPHVQKLLDVFGYFSGIKNPQPIAIGGSTNAKLLPNAVSFGPAMPGVPYTGHSEHEFITEAQMALNLRMYTAMMIEMGQIP